MSERISHTPIVWHQDPVPCQGQLRSNILSRPNMAVLGVETSGFYSPSRLSHPMAPSFGPILKMKKKLVVLAGQPQELRISKCGRVQKADGDGLWVVINGRVCERARVRWLANEGLFLKWLANEVAQLFWGHPVVRAAALSFRRITTTRDPI